MSKAKNLQKESEKLRLTRAQRIKKHFARCWFYYLLALPAVAWLIMFAYIPMVGIYMSFTKYTYSGGIFGSPFIGLENFQKLKAIEPQAWRALKNTIVINGIGTVLGMICSIGFAVTMSEVRHDKFRKAAQSSVILPYLISWVAVGGIAEILLSTDVGLLNKMREAMGQKPISWYMEPKYWTLIMPLVTTWKGFGYSSIVYYATICGIDPQLFEAAKVDGAGRMKRIWHITLPLLKPTVVLLFILGFGGIINMGMDVIIGVTRSLEPLIKTTDSLSYLIYRVTTQISNPGISSALSLLCSLASFFLVMGANLIAKKVNPDYALF